MSNERISSIICDAYFEASNEYESDDVEGLIFNEMANDEKIDCIYGHLSLDNKSEILFIVGCLNIRSTEDAEILDGILKSVFMSDVDDVKSGVKAYIDNNTDLIEELIFDFLSGEIEAPHFKLGVQT
jgi:hypothetical protein